MDRPYLITSRHLFLAVFLILCVFWEGNQRSEAEEMPQPPATIPKEPSNSKAQDEVIERGIMRDHRGQPKVFAPPINNQSTTAPVIRDHRQQQGNTSSLTGTSSYGPPPPLGPPPAVQPVNDIGINFLITSQVRNQVNHVVAQANADAANQTSVRAKIKVESFKNFGAGMSATQFTDRPNHRFVRIPYMVSYKIFDVDKNTAVGWIPTGVTRILSQSIGIHLFCDKWETGNGTIKLQTDIQPLYLEDSQGTAEQIVDFFLNGHLTNFIDGLVRQQLNQIPITNGSTNLPFPCKSLAANKHQTPDPTDDTVDFNPPTPVRPTGQTVFNQVSVKFIRLKRLPAKDLSGQPLYIPIETPALEVYANFQHSYVPLQAIQEGQTVPLNIPAFSMNKPTGNEFLLILANVIQEQTGGGQLTDSAYRVFTKDGNFGNGTQTLIIKKSFWQPPRPPLQPKPLQNFRDAYELTVQINAPRPEMAFPGTGTAPTPGTVKPGTFGTPFQGILKRGTEPDASNDPSPANPDGSPMEDPPSPTNP